MEPSAGYIIEPLTANEARNTSGAQIRWSWQRWKIKPSMISSCCPPPSLFSYHPLFFQVVCHFQTLLAVSQCLSHSVCLPLSVFHSLHHTYKQRELSLAYRDPLLLWSKAFIWWLGLKNGHLLLPLINWVSVFFCVCEFVFFIQSAVCLERLDTDKSVTYILCLWIMCVCWREYKESRMGNIWKQKKG